MSESSRLNPIRVLEPKLEPNPKPDPTSTAVRVAVQPGPSRAPAREAQNETDPIYILPWIGDLGGTCDWGGCDEPAVAKRWDARHGWLPVCETHKDSDDA